MKLKKILIYFFFLLIIFSPNLHSQIIEKVEVKGQLFSNEPNSKNIVIITEKDLEQLGIKEISEFFSFFPAVNISRRGAFESSYDITMRGSNFEQVLILVNGVPLNNVQTGHFNTDFPFSIADIKRIEIIRGGSSTTYGAGAFAGVINIILKKESDFGISATIGDNKLFSSNLFFGKRLKKKNLSLRFSINKNSSSGYHQGREFDQIKVTAGSYYQNKNIRVDLYGGFMKKDFGAQGFYAPFPSYEKIESYFSQFKVKKFFSRFNFSLSYSFNKHKDFFILDRYRPEYFDSESNTNFHIFNLSTSYKTQKIFASCGIDIKRENMKSTSMGTQKRNHQAFFLNVNYFINKKLGVDVCIRESFFSEWDSSFTFYSGFYHHISPGIVTRIGYGKSFRIPSFTELFYNSPANKGNEDLEPEISYNFETSVSILKEKYQLDLSLFYRNQKNTIDWVKYTENFPWQAVNINKNDMIGIELTQQFKLNRTKIIFGVEKLAAVNKEEGFQSKYGLRFPDFSVKLNLLHPIGKKITTSFNYLYKQIFNTDEKGHFLNFGLNIPIGKFEISFRVRNLFNTIIEEIPGLKVPGRWAYLTIKYN